MTRTRVLALITIFLLLPVAALAEGDAEKGKAAFATYCVSCHGPAGAGDGPAAAALNPKPRNLSDKTYMSGLKDDYLFKVVKDGGPAVGKSPLMAPWGGSLKDDEIRDVVAFLRTLTK